jgi:hypothetical protein
MHSSLCGECLVSQPVLLSLKTQLVFAKMAAAIFSLNYACGFESFCEGS